MNTEFKAKFLSHLNQRKKGDKGFTLIELLVVIIIIGILAAIALPAFLNQANKAKQSEAKTNSGSVNRAQQAYYLEKAEFANAADFSKLGLGIQTQSGNYKFVIVDGGKDSTAATIQAQPIKGAKDTVKAYIGGVNAGVLTGTKEATTLTVLCEGIDAPIAGGAQAVEKAIYSATGGPKCPPIYNDASTNKPSV
ncbi:type IV pilin-like G/H family protein [Leptolyngbyaceae cyanobacterium UHCC 1019]